MIKINFQNKKRRGLSSIVGALIFVVLMVATFTVLGVALNSQSNIVETNVEVAETGLKKTQEKFSISVYTDTNEILSVDVDNQGQNPVEIHSLVITNQTGSAAELADFPTQIHDIVSETSFVASDDKKDIVSTTPLKLNLAASGETEIYHFKVISSLGTIKTVQLTCDEFQCGAVSSGGGDLIATLFLDGPNGVNTKTSTIIMIVSNTYDVDLTDVQPTVGYEGSGTCVANNFLDITESVTETIVSPETFEPCTANPASAIPLAAHSTALFKWDGIVNGDVDSIFQFCSNVQAMHPTDGAITGLGNSCDSLTIINPNDCGGCGESEGGESIILIDDLLIRPSIFMTIPSPFGDATDGDDEKGLWGVNVANPTDRGMSISKVTIVAFPPGGDASDVVFNGAKSGINQCLEEDVLPSIGPSPGGYWNCPRDNTIMWQNFTSPVILPANSTKSFMLKVEPGDIFVSGRNLDALIVQANVYSTFGSFGKSGYQSTMYERDAPIVNVYLTDAADLRSGFIGNVNNIANYSSTTFNAVLADMDDNPLTFINTGAKFIINVPREWTFEEFISCEGFEDAGTPGICNGPNEPIFTVHSDGSTQIIATSTSIIGDGSTDDVTDPSEARKVSFKATSASVKTPRLYVMYILADGIVTTPDGDRTIGPVSEVVLNVDPPS